LSSTTLEALAEARTRVAELSAQAEVEAQAERIRDAQREAEAATNVQADLTDRLGKIREELRSTRAFYASASVTIKAQSEARDLVRAAIARANQVISDHLAEKPPVADYLINDPEVVAWQLELRRLGKERDDLVADFTRLPDPQLHPDFDKAVACEGPDGLIATLELAERNVLRELDKGKSGKNWAPNGGVSGVH